MKANEKTNDKDGTRKRKLLPLFKPFVPVHGMDRLIGAIVQNQVQPMVNCSRLIETVETRFDNCNS